MQELIMKPVNLAESLLLALRYQRLTGMRIRGGYTTPSVASTITKSYSQLTRQRAVAGRVPRVALPSAPPVLRRPISSVGSDGAAQQRQHQRQWYLPEGHDTGVVVFNSQTRTKTPLVLPHGRIATWYQCGPTVYEDPHLGHALCYVRSDILRRLLEEFFGIDVVMVMGVTDVNDKVFDRARELGVDYQHVAKTCEARFFDDMAKVKVLPPTVVTRVSEHIPQVVAFVSRLVDRGFAYKTPRGSVYFDVSRYGRYGKLMTHSIETEVRESHDPEKKHPRDFALWKAAKPGEPTWRSPWSAGRPGWHIECSTMASEVFGRKLDIHTGGIDLLFPHHENEVAQSESYHGCSQWVNYWMHTGHLYVKGQRDKMSKSLKNTISLCELQRKYTPNQFRLMCFLSHYRKNVEYSDELMERAVSVQSRLKSFLTIADAYIQGKVEGGRIDEAELMRHLMDVRGRVHVAIADDFDTPRAMDAIMELVAVCNRLLKHEPGVKPERGMRSPGAMAAVVAYIDRVLNAVGIQFSHRMATDGEQTERRLSRILDSVVSFRRSVRQFALDAPAGGATTQPDAAAGGATTQPDGGATAATTLEVKSARRRERAPLLGACDALRDDLLLYGVKIKDRAGESFWERMEEALEEQVEKPR